MNKDRLQDEVNKEKLQEIKDIINGKGLYGAWLTNDKVKWLISEVERLQTEQAALGNSMQVLLKLYQESVSEGERLKAYIRDETVPKQFDTMNLIDAKLQAERLYLEALEKNNRLKLRSETLKKIEESWIDIETNGNQADAMDFYTVVQDILSDYEHEKSLQTDNKTE